MLVTEKDVEQVGVPEIADFHDNMVTMWFHEALRQVTFFLVLRLLIPLRVYGTEHLRSVGPYIFAANHASHLDAPLVLAALPLRLRLRLCVAAAADYFFTNWWKSTVVRSLINAFPFERKGPASCTSLAHARQLLKEGRSILLFPEGTRSKDGHIQPFKRGVGRLAVVGTAPVVPVWIEGTHAALPKGARRLHRQSIIIRFGKPLSFTPHDDVSFVVAEIERQVQQLASQS